MKNEMAVSVIIPAHNEEKYIGKCLEAVNKAAKAISPDKVEVIVVANRCTDRTSEIAEQSGAAVITNEDISKEHTYERKNNCGMRE